jgi:hypothetical protein
LTFGASGYFHEPGSFDIILPQIAEPTDDNLRAAGMIPVRLVDMTRPAEHPDDETDPWAEWMASHAAKAMERNTGV